MNSYSPDWKSWDRGRAHLVARDTTQRGYTENPKTLCGKRAKKMISAFRGEPRCSRCVKKRKDLDHALIGDSNIVYLDERSYEGAPGCARAYHWSGSICIGDLHSVDLTFRMTYLQARKANAEQPDYAGWEEGSISNRFFTRKALQVRAIEELKALWPAAGALIAATRWNPGEVLWLPDQEGKLLKLNSTCRHWDQALDECPNDECKIIELEKEFKTLLAEAGLVA